MDPVVKPIACPACGKTADVRVIPNAATHVYHCPHCKKIVSAKG